MKKVLEILAIVFILFATCVIIGCAFYYAYIAIIAGFSYMGTWYLY